MWKHRTSKFIYSLIKYMPRRGKTIKKSSLKSKDEASAILLTTEDVANLLKLKTSTLTDWRYKHTGPKYLKRGNMIRYRPSDILEFERQAFELIEPKCLG